MTTELPRITDDSQLETTELTINRDVNLAESFAKVERSYFAHEGTPVFVQLVRGEIHPRTPVAMCGLHFTEAEARQLVVAITSLLDTPPAQATAAHEPTESV
jgi:hypothetical protein